MRTSSKKKTLFDQYDLIHKLAAMTNVDMASSCQEARRAPQAVTDIAWKAQLRLTVKFKRLSARG